MVTPGRDAPRHTKKLRIHLETLDTSQLHLSQGTSFGPFKTTRLDLHDACPNWQGCILKRNIFDRNIDLRNNSSTLPYCTGECEAPVPLVCYGVTCYNRITFPYQVPRSAVQSIKYPWSIVDRTLSFWTLLYREDTDT